MKKTAKPLLTPPLPTAYEVAQLAIALRGREAASHHIEAAREALGVWLAASHELRKAEGRDFMDNACNYSGTISADGSLEGRLLGELLNDDIYERNRRNPNPDLKRLWLFSREESPVLGQLGKEISPGMDWINENAPASDGQLKTVGKFKTAWQAYEPNRNHLFTTVQVSDLKTFLAHRKTKRLETDAERKRLNREKANNEENLPNKSSKIEGGQKPKASRKKPR